MADDVSIKVMQDSPVTSALTVMLRIMVTLGSRLNAILYRSVSQPPGRGPVPCPGINYTGPREVLPEFILVF